MRSILLIHKTPLLTTKVGSWEKDWYRSRCKLWRTQFRPSWSVKTHDQLRDLVGRTRDWLTGNDISIRVLVWCLPASLQSTKPHYRQQGRVCKAGTVVTVDVSSEERTSDLPGRWKHVTCFVIGRKDTRLADWIWRQRSRSFELAGRLMLLKQRSLGQYAL